MTVSSTTPEDVPRRCPVCGAAATVEPPRPTGDACCPACGELLEWFRDRLTRQGRFDDVHLHDSFAALGLSSLEWVEMVLDFEEEFQIDVPEEDIEQIQTVQGAIGYIRRRMVKAR